MWSQISALDDRFWIVNVMEMLERLAYYGTRAVIALYIVGAISDGGLEFTHAQKGTIFAWWAFIQSMLPMYTGGLADRYGHKNVVVGAILLKVAGYLMMSTMTSYYGFLAACLLLAAGTAIFKPGIQGTLAATIKKKEASLGWGIFYQLVNVGGFVGPTLAGVLRFMSWDYVFWSCALIVSLNFLWLPFYRTPTEEARSGPANAAERKAETRETWGRLSRSLGRAESWFWAAFWTLANLGLSLGWWTGYVTLKVDDYVLLTLMFGIYQLAFYVFAPLKVAWFDRGPVDPFSVIVTSTVGMFQSRILFFCVVFAGFWVMFNQVFDLLPNSIEDWVDSTDVLTTWAAVFSVPGASVVAGALAGAGMACLSAVGVWLALRPDRRQLQDNGFGPWIVTGIALAGAGWPIAAAAAQPLAPWTGVFTALIGVVVALAIGLGGAAALASSRLGARAAIGVALVIGLGGWSWVGIFNMWDLGVTLSDLAAAGAQVNPEWMLNVNAGMIVFTMVFFAWISGFVRPLTSILLGMVVATGGALIAGVFDLGWVCILGIAVFSVGEMLSSPKKLEYLASLSGKGQEGLYMGYANVPVALGWIFGSLFAGNRYEEIGDKVNLARTHLVTATGMDPAAAAALDEGAVVETLAARLGSTTLEVQRLLFDLYDPWWVWVEIAGIGLVSAVGMVVYDRVLRAIDRAKVSQ